MKKTFLVLLTVAVALIAMAYTVNTSPSNKLRMAEEAIAGYYVDTVNEDKIVEAAIKAMLKELDPHSTYSSAEETSEFNETMQGSFSGIGITFNMTNDTLYVIETISGGPSDKVGVMAGDRFLRVNDTIIAGVKMKNTDIRKFLRGPKGTPVNVQVLRGKTDTIDFTIIRDIIPVYSVDAAYMADATTGYIKLNKFAQDTHKEVLEALAKLRKQGMQDLILDLTDNGGGYLIAAVDLVSEFIEPDQLVVYTQGERSQRYERISRPEGRKPAFDDGRLVVMVNQNTASASEITSGAVQDWDRGLIVGRRTYGKGLVQRPFPFPDGSMIKLTIAHYYTPSGRNIQRPYTKGERADYDNDILKRLNSGELMHADSIKYDEELKTTTLVNKRPIYGGGGISPDLFVALDTTMNTKYYRSVMAKGLFNQFTVKYLDTERRNLKRQYKNALDYFNRYNVTDEMVDNLVELATKEGIEPNPEQLQASHNLFKQMLKAMIGRDVFGNEAYFRTINVIEPIYMESLRLIHSDEYDDLLNGHKP